MITGVPVDRIAIEINADIEKCLEKLIPFFKDEPLKRHAWLLTENPMFGNVSPIFMIFTRRTDKVMRFINTSIEENTLEEASKK